MSNMSIFPNIIKADLGKMVIGMMMHDAVELKLDL